ncbi:VanW family protein [Candidatus Peregrinibacteria bacterium]|nr:VanW family protein [Candidatus Peregrinibacteria bacterium]
MGKNKNASRKKKNTLTEKQREESKKTNRHPILFIIATIIFPASMVVSTIFFREFVHQRIPIQTSVGDIDLSFNTTDEAAKKLEDAEREYKNKSFKITALNKEINFSPQEMGIDLLPNKTAQKIKVINIEKENFLRALDLSKKNMDMEADINKKQQVKKIKEKFDLQKIYPREATFYFDEDKRLAVREGKSGFVIDEEKLFNDINSAAKKLETPNITIDLKNENPKVTAKDLEQKTEEAKKLLRKTIVIKHGNPDRKWVLQVFNNKELIEFATEKTSDDIKIYAGVKPKEFNEFIDKTFSEEMEVPVETVNIYVDEKGEPKVNGRGNDGILINREKLKRDFEGAINTALNVIELRTEKVSPKIVATEQAKALGLTERISFGYTTYYGSPENRVHNIKTGAEKFNGKVIKPGETFSFNDTLGQVDETTGYKKELVIKKDGTIPEYGGGICQVSTTMYRAALFAGLPIKERNQHTYAVSYYSQVLGHGLDATIYLGGANLKFENDTGNYVLVQAFVKDDYELYFILYGTSDGRKVSMEGPYLSNYKSPGQTIYENTDSLFIGQKKQQEKAHTGFEALWYRHLTLKDGTEKKEEIKTRYQAIPSKILVGTKEKL